MRLIPVAAVIALTLAAPVQAALAPGAVAPDFNTHGAMAGAEIRVKLADLRKKGPVVLYFFPAAYTPGCNAEAKAFADTLDQFTAAGATVVGMSADPVSDLKHFSVSHCAGKFAVASVSYALIRRYDVALGQQINGRPAASRTSYVIGRDGRILLAISDPAPGRHIRETLAMVQSIAKNGH